jgi:hypothetical protein
MRRIAVWRILQEVDSQKLGPLETTAYFFGSFQQIESRE